MNGAVALDGRLGRDGFPLTTDSLKWPSVKTNDNNEIIKEGGLNNVDKALKEGLSKDEAIKAGFGEKDIIDRGLEDNTTIKKATEDGPNAEKDGDNFDETGLLPPKP